MSFNLKKIDCLFYRLYSAHIDRLSSTIVPDHPKLQIPSKYLVECPWTSAQQQAKSMSTFRSPRGKLQAAVRFVFELTFMNVHVLTCFNFYQKYY